MRRPHPIDTDALERAYSYDPVTGHFTRRHAGGGKQAGTVVTGGRSRVYLCVSGKLVRSSRAAWTLLNGPIPDGMEVDHINGDKRDDRASNLRLATHAQNLRNRAVHRNNRTGVKGVTRYRSGYLAMICVAGRRIYLGTFDTLESAARAYAAAAAVHFGEFVRA